MNINVCINRMKMKTMILLALLALTGFAQAQTRVSGTVTDRNTGKPLEGATVAILNGPSTFTNAKGQYRITIPSQTAPILQASFLGFSSAAAIRCNPALPLPTSPPRNRSLRKSR